jgi:hypothetical protein
MQKSLSDITDLASLFFTPREIAIMLEMPADEFVAACQDENSEEYKAFQSGRLQSEVDLRKSIIKLAKSGSSPAQTMSMDLLKQSKIKILDR